MKSHQEALKTAGGIFATPGPTPGGLGTPAPAPGGLFGLAPVLFD